ncbi:MAG: hypothetical protein AB9835_11630 [Eubacteriales bacterium]
MDYKKIRDNVHGYISIPDSIIKNIVDTSIFQRLRRIEQTSMRCLYPSARHDRFTHSLGVYHLGCKAFDGLLINVKNHKEYYYLDDGQFWDKYKILFTIACLLHDCAHAPFSHSLEYLYFDKNNPDKTLEVRQRLLDAMTKLKIDNDKTYTVSEFVSTETEKSVNHYLTQKVSPHELASSIIVSEYFALYIIKVLEDIFDNYKIEDCIVDDIQFIQRAIIGLTYDLELFPEKKLDNQEYRHTCYKNCLIKLLKSDTFDVDRLDYLIRDTKESGVDSVSIDVERLLGALTLVESHEYINLTNIEGILDNSIVISESFNFDNIINGTYNELVIELNNINLSGHIKGTIQINEGTLYKKTGDQNKLTDGCKFMVDDGFEGSVRSGFIRGSYVGQISSMQEGTISGSAGCKITGEIKGKIIGKINLNDAGLTYLDITYKKDAISIIEDTITARNRLYIWIYSHHKVVYSDYVLRNALLYAFADKNENILESKNKANEKLSNLISIDSFILKNGSQPLDDGNLTTIIKESSINTNNEYAIEWISRKYKHSIWKSYAEFNLLFSTLTEFELQRMWNCLFDSSNTTNHSNKDEGNSKEYVNSSLKSYICNGKNVNFVWIRPSSTNVSTLNYKNTYVLLNERVVRLNDVMIKEKISEEYASKNFFYLYSSEVFSTDDKFELITFLKRMVR